MRLRYGPYYYMVIKNARAPERPRRGLPHDQLIMVAETHITRYGAQQRVNGEEIYYRARPYVRSVRREHPRAKNREHK